MIQEANESVSAENQGAALFAFQRALHARTWELAPTAWPSWGTLTASAPSASAAQRSKRTCQRLCVLLSLILKLGEPSDRLGSEGPSPAGYQSTVSCWPQRLLCLEAGRHTHTRVTRGPYTHLSAEIGAEPRIPTRTPWKTPKGGPALCPPARALVSLASPFGGDASLAMVRTQNVGYGKKGKAFRTPAPGLDEDDEEEENLEEDGEEGNLEEDGDDEEGGAAGGDDEEAEEENLEEDIDEEEEDEKPKKGKRRKRNPMVDDEAGESDDDDEEEVSSFVERSSCTRTCSSSAHEAFH